MSAASILKAIAKLTAKGYPEEVAERIAKGELPMDPASVAKRADEQGYGPTMYRGHPNNNPPRSDQDLWMSDDIDVSETYVTGGEYYDEATDSYKRLPGTLTPLKHNAGDNLFRYDAEGEWYEDLHIEPSDVPGLSETQFFNDFRSGSTDGIAEMVKAEGTRKGTEFKDVVDYAGDDVHMMDMQTANVHNILGSRPDVKIRHPDAAFDPQYNGPNIMGGAAGTAGLTGLLAAGQSDDSEASVASLAKRGLRIVEGHSPASTSGDSLFDIVDGRGDDIGGAEFWVTPGGDLNAYGMRLYPEHRGTGIMNEAYDAIEEISGRKIEPSDVLTEDGMKFWIRRDPRKMQKLYERERFDYYEKDVLDSIFAEALEAKR
jgi:GNAT superfamily N-acetyltransferase